MQRKVKLMTKKKISFEDSLEDTDYGLIIGAGGELKGLFIPESEDEDYIPPEIYKILKDVYKMHLVEDAVTIH